MTQKDLNDRKFRLAIIFGGPSLERGISINSARSVVDNLSDENLEILPIYVDLNLNFYPILAAQLYSNTPADFDFKLAQETDPLSKHDLIAVLSEMDLVFPAIHGKYGEDGSLQLLLEENQIPFIGSKSETCRKMLNKTSAMNLLQSFGYDRINSITLNYRDKNNSSIISDFFAKHGLARAIVKPESGGSSIGVFSVNTPEEALEKLQSVYKLSSSENIILEEFCSGKEFTAIVVGRDKEAISLIPSEINVSYDNGQIFDYRSKYLPTKNISYSCPPSFADSVIETIQNQAEDIFIKFEMQDFARLDGWVLNDGRIIFTDLNPISGMEQNSFMFQQSAKVGLSHREILEYIVKNACRRYNKRINLSSAKVTSPKKVNILFGGSTAERQVSVMSGTNVWLKLLKSKLFKPALFFLDINNEIWDLPYSYALSHTVEEILSNCLESEQNAVKIKPYLKKIRSRLDLIDDYSENLTKKYSLDDFLAITKSQDAFLFLGLHGGEGENGTLQKLFGEIGINYNGSNAYSSSLCMDKFETGIEIERMNDPDISALPKKIIRLDFLDSLTDEQAEQYWSDLLKFLEADAFIIKPRSDGCSAGVVKLNNAAELKKYAYFVNNNSDYIPNNSFIDQQTIIELADNPDTDFIVEPYFVTDKISMVDKELHHHNVSGWIELTVGVLEKRGNYHALNPSITVAQNTVLTVEEKFQGGTGINITPLPEKIMSQEANNKVKSSIEKVASCLKISNYARIDIFANVLTGNIVVIEANSLPALTPSTVIFHQAFAEIPPMTPLAFLENIILSKISAANHIKETASLDR